MPTRKPPPQSVPTRAAETRAAVVGPIVAVCGNDRGDTGPPADLLICHDVVNRNALQIRIDRFRFAGHFGTNPANLLETEGHFQDRFTPRYADDRKAGQKKYSAAPVFPRPFSLGFEPRPTAKCAQERLKGHQNEVGSASSVAVGKASGVCPLPVPPYLDGMSAPACDLPAILGGTPQRPEGPPAWPFPDPDVQAALAAAVAGGAWGQYHGEHVCALEGELAAFHHVPHAITCATGTLAVEAALRALRVGPGDEVVMAAYEYESNFLTVHALGAKPVLTDVHPENWQLDPANLEAAFTPQTKAVICTHLHGGLVPMREVTELARRHNVGVVEDAAQAPGATVQGRPAGTWGDVGTLSFGGSKLLSAGRGGALLFRDAHLHQRAKVFLHRGLQQWAPLSELQAAALRPQLRKLPEATRVRAGNVELLVGLVRSNPSPGSLACFADFARHPLPQGERVLVSPSPLAGEGGERSEPGEGSLSLPAFYKLGFRYDASAFGIPRELFVKALRAEGIAFDVGFKALHVGRSPSRFRAAGELPHATAAHERCVILHHPVLSLSRADVQQVADAVVKVYRAVDELTISARKPGPPI
jgi:dTDP-4-amino-4,6-dideoxygalactose transaminase